MKLHLLWRDLPEKMTEGFSKKQLIFYFIVLLTIQSTLWFKSDIALTFYTLSQFCLLFIAFKLAKKIRTGKKYLNLKKSHQNKRLYSISYTVILHFFLWVGIPIIMYSLNVFSYFTLPSPITNNPDYMSEPISSDISFLFGHLIHKALTSSEEVARLLMMIFVLIFCQKLFKNKWNNAKYQWFFLSFALIVSSFIFGWSHSEVYANSFFDPYVTLYFGVQGLIYGIGLIVTRRLWLIMIYHALSNMLSIVVALVVGFETIYFVQFGLPITLFLIAPILIWLFNRVKEESNIIQETKPNIYA